MPKRRVVITGLGCVTSIGQTQPAFWKAACEGRSGVSVVTRFDTAGFDVRIASWIPDFNPDPLIPPRDARRIDRYAQLALVAADEAVRDSGLDLAREDLDRAGVIIGSGIGGLQEIEEQKTILLQRGPGRVSPFLIPKMMANSAGGLLGIQFGLRGPNSTVLTACASSSHAIGDAYLNIACDMADVLLTGGSEATITPLGLAGFIACKALSKRNDEPTRASRPFDRERDGFVMGEGAGILVFEELEHAKARGARIYAEVLGFGATCDAYHITAPEPQGTGASRSMAVALRDAGLAPDAVTYINAHGTSTQLNDAMETRAIKRTFGDHARKLAINSTKSMIGHLLGASGGVELAQTALSIAHGLVPPTINYENPDPECDLDYVPNVAREMKVDVAMCNSFGFGGHNASILIGKLR
ncbi:MAG TPA: beta-ketoacyl-ACP synthase II [Planctomycetota bacterium]|nr:beta-ketoacyl-ACP synthase II [Planctomycetota bacterium]